MARVQLGLDVSELGPAVDFYTRLLGVPPAKLEPGYANFAVDDPPLKLVLFEKPDNAGGLDHLGVEVESPDEARVAGARLAAEGLETRSEEGVDCCYAVQDKVWVRDPDDVSWEVYTVRAHSEKAVDCCA